MNELEVKKPIKAKPMFYACCLLDMQKIARDLGYNLVIHGSMDRDMDLVAIPWSETPSTHYELLIELDLYLRGVNYTKESFEQGYMYSKLPGGRSSYVLNINRGGKYNNYTDEQWYVDISITPSYMSLFLENATLVKQFEECEKLLAALSDLKAIKDGSGKTEFYMQQQPKVWAEVAEYIKNRFSK